MQNISFNLNIWRGFGGALAPATLATCRGHLRGHAAFVEKFQLFRGIVAWVARNSSRRLGLVSVSRSGAVRRLFFVLDPFVQGSD